MLVQLLQPVAHLRLRRRHRRFPLPQFLFETLGPIALLLR